MNRRSVRRLGAKLSNGGVAMAVAIAFSLLLLPATAMSASFDLDGDGKQETHLISECGALVAFKQTISHTVTNGLQSEVIVKWPAAGLVDYPVPKGATPKVQSYETYKSCIPGDDKGVEFKIASKGVRRFDRGAPAAVPGFVTRWFVDAVKEMGLAEAGKAIRELSLIARSFLGGKPIVSTTSQVTTPRLPGEKFQYRYSVENHTTEGIGFFVKGERFGFEGFVEPGKKWEKTIDAPNAPTEEAAQMTVKAKIPEHSGTDLPLSVLYAQK